MEKKENKKDIILYKRVETQIEEMDINQNRELKNYNELKEQLAYNLKLDIDSKFQRMKILYEIKQKNLYKYDGFDSFEQFIKSYVINKSQAYIYIKIYQEVLEGNISVEEIKKQGFSSVYRKILKNQLESSEHKKDRKKDCDNSCMPPVKFLIKDKEVYSFCIRDTKRAVFILEKIIKDRRDILFSLVMEYENKEE